MKQIVVDFGPVRAVDGVDFSVEPGEIRGLIGENGAGKSTLMNALAGTFLPTQGEIYLDNEPVRLDSALKAMRHGIRFIHQELNLCNDLRVFENLYLAQELTGLHTLLKKREMAGRAAEVFRRMNVEIDPRTMAGDLQAAEKQLVEIARALLHKCELIIMDEPTTALNNREIENLFFIMRQLKAGGVSFIYISHKMPEIFAICETYSVLRDGRLVGQGRIGDIDESGITEMMTGRLLADEDFARKPCYRTDEPALIVKNLAGDGFRNISFTLYRGEILAFTGLGSSGRDQLADALFGVIPHAGELIVNGRAIRRGGIAGRLKRRIAMVPRNRKERGILTDLSIYDNLLMGFFNTLLKTPLINIKEVRDRYTNRQASLNIKADNPKDRITSLSGGNQQKVILGRWLEIDADVLIFDNPTQGIDVGTKFEIYRLLIDLAKNGKAIMVFSSEYPEIYKVADRCAVMYRGEMNALIDRADITESGLMYYSTGSNAEGAQYA
jgi:ribose transport system ATP-binding protein